MSARAPLPAETFDGNRAVGRIELTVAAAAGRSRRGRVHEAGALRVRFPNSDGQALEAVTINTAGGMTGGDRFDIDVKVGPGAGLTLTTAAAEKIYRSLGPDTEIRIKLDVGRGGTLAWLPQETILFDRIRLRRSIDVELGHGAQLLLAEAILFGRAAMGETVTQGRLTDRWRVRVGGALVFAETVRLEGPIGPSLTRSAVAAGAVAVATVLKFPSTDKDVAAIRAMSDNLTGDAGISAWNGFAVARLVAPDGAALRRDLIEVLAALGPVSVPRLWRN